MGRFSGARPASVTGGGPISFVAARPRILLKLLVNFRKIGAEA
jgi:hypothetical protein